MRIAVLQHVPFEGPAAIADWAARRGHQVRIHRSYSGEPLPRLDDFDWLVAMGGPMSVNDEETLPWLVDEMRLIAATVEANKRMLGVCLGAQLLAKALGARVYRAEAPEIGWFPVTAVKPEIAHPLAFVLPTEFLAFHWHGETFDLPDGAIRLAETPVCTNQAFAVGDRAIGVQFHLEATRVSVVHLTLHCGHEIGTSRYEQPAARMGDTPSHFDDLKPILYGLLDAIES